MNDTLHIEFIHTGIAWERQSLSMAQFQFYGQTFTVFKGKMLNNYDYAKWVVVF